MATKALPCLSLLLLAVLSSRAATTCLPIDAGQAIKAVLSTASAPCFVFTVNSGEPAELIAEQPVDLELRVTSENVSNLIDSFSLGAETATLLAAGTYRLEVHAVGKIHSSFAFLMSRRAVSLQEAVARSAAETAGSVAKRSGKPQDSEHALDLWTTTGDLSATGRSQLMRGEAAYKKSDLKLAIELFELALGACRPAGDLVCIAAAANNGGAVAEQAGQFEPALALLTEAAAGFKRLGDPVAEGQAFSNLGVLFRLTGDYEGAIGYYDRAGATLAPRDAVAYAAVLNNLGVCYQSLAEYGQARIYFERALREYTLHRIPKSPVPEGAVRARLNLGRNWLLEGNPALARKILEQTLAEASARNDQLARADALNNLGRVSLADGLNIEALGELEGALAIHRASGGKRALAIDLHYLGVAANARGDIPAARTYFTEAVDIRTSHGLRDPATESLFALAALEQADGHPQAARDLAGRGLALMESVRSQVPGAELRASFYARQRRFLDLLVDLETTPDNPRAAEDGLLAAERGRGRALTDLLAEGRLLHVPDELLARRLHVQRQIDLLAGRLATAPAELARELRSQVENLVSEDEEIEAGIRQSLAGQKLGSPLTSVAALVADGLPGDTALLEYHLSEKQSYLWVVEAGGVRLFRLPSRTVLESQCAPVLRWFPAILERKRSPETQRSFERALHQLSATLLANIGGLRLPARLVIVPDGVLTRIPFAALELPGNRRLGLAYDLVQAPSAQYLQAGRAPRRVAEFPRTFLAFADPVYAPNDPRVTSGPVTPPGAPSDLARLPFNAELDTVRGLTAPARRRILTGFEATAGALKSARLEDYAVVHFSAHALIDDRIPELSRIALSMVGRSGRPVDGFLRPYQLSQLALNGSTVVLSACETALGKQVLGEGLAGFTTSLFSAGAAQLVLTLSPTDAEGSSEFLSRTYRNLFGPRPVAMERAITLARRSLAQSARWSDPYYWAAFAVYGRPSEALERP